MSAKKRATESEPPEQAMAAGTAAMAEAQRQARPSELAMAKRAAFDRVAWGSHCVDCYPGACPYRVYVRDGRVVREEVAGTLEPFEEGVPDMNPLGCQKGAAWARQLDAPDRLLHPLRRVGPRGSGSWQRITWDEALTEIADTLIDVLESDGGEAIVHEGTPEIVTAPAVHRFMHLVGGLITDINGSINDLAVGHHLTFGRFYPIGSNDDIFHSDLVILWNTNPSYTTIPFYHYLTEVRYRGGEVVLLSPDVSPSHCHVDYHIPLEWGSDPALALSMCQVVVEEGLLDAEFVARQTDLALLVRADTGLFLRESDLRAGGSEEVFMHLDADSGDVRPASRTDLLAGETPALDGCATVRLASGESVEARPLMVRLRESLDTTYRPEQTAQTTGVNPETVRLLARKVASRPTKVLMGMGACKTYHSDLYQRTMNLLLALTGNWGKKGTGINCWATGLFDGQMSAMLKQRPGVEGAEDVFGSMRQMADAVKQEDPTYNDELASIELWRRLPAMGGRAMVPAFFLWYHHTRLRERWENTAWSDPAMRKGFAEYYDEAMEKGWWSGMEAPAAGTTPRVLIECGGNQLRRTRGGRRALLDSLWENLRLVVAIEVRMSATALNADIVLPAAQHYEKVAFHLPSPSMLTLTLSDKAVEPPGEALDEWEIFALLCRKLGERATARGIESYRLPGPPATATADATTGATTGAEANGAATATQPYGDLWDRFTLAGRLLSSEDVGDEMVRDTAHAGTLPPGTTLESLRRDGPARFIDWGTMPMALGQSSPWPVNETHSPFRNHVERGWPYPTLTRRAQFLIEHPWFIEAGEDLPVHKDPPKMGGEHPFRMTSGHNRWSIHAMNMGNRMLLETHRGRPHAVIHPHDAERLGIADDGLVRVRNDVGSFTVHVKTSPCQRPGGLTVYNGFDNHMFAGHEGPNEVEPGLVKWLHMAGGYGHLRYAPMEWQPSPVDRPVFVSVEPAA
ncbi:MAG: molybdopterin-dependent oxidoreductase [Solirubrobacteraceae bacterium]